MQRYLTSSVRSTILSLRRCSPGTTVTKLFVRFRVVQTIPSLPSYLPRLFSTVDDKTTRSDRRIEEANIHHVMHLEDHENTITEQRFAEESEKLVASLQSLNQHNPLHDIIVSFPDANTIILSVYNGQLPHPPASTASPSSSSSSSIHNNHSDFRPSETPQQITVTLYPADRELRVESMSGTFAYRYSPLLNQWKCCSSYGDYGHDILQFIYHEIGIMSKGYAGKRY